MDIYDSSDRGAGSLVLFALGFLGFLTAAGGVILTSPVLALGGAALWIFAVSCFALAHQDGD